MTATRGFSKDECARVLRWFVQRKKHVITAQHLSYVVSFARAVCDRVRLARLAVPVPTPAPAASTTPRPAVGLLRCLRLLPDTLLAASACIVVAVLAFCLAVARDALAFPLATALGFVGFLGLAAFLAFLGFFGCIWVAAADHRACCTRFASQSLPSTTAFARNDSVNSSRHGTVYLRYPRAVGADIHESMHVSAPHNRARKVHTSNHGLVTHERHVTSSDR